MVGIFTRGIMIMCVVMGSSQLTSGGTESALIFPGIPVRIAGRLLKKETSRWVLVGRPILRMSLSRGF